MLNSKIKYRRPNYNHQLIGLQPGDAIVFCVNGKETHIKGEIVGQETAVWLIDTTYPTIESASNRAYMELEIPRKSERNSDWKLWKHNGRTLYQIYDEKFPKK